MRKEAKSLCSLSITFMLHYYADVHSTLFEYRTSVLFVSISFIVLMMISLAWLVFYYVQRFRYIHAKDRLSRRLCSAARKALSKIPTKVIKSDDKEMQGDYECCAVCIEPYKISDVLRILPCRHEFHKSCIDPWLLEHRTCPMCKMDILKHYGFVFTGSQESILHVEIEEVVGLSPTASPEPESSQQNNLSPQRTHTPHTRSQNSDQQPPIGSPVDQRSRSSSPEDLRPSTSSGFCTVQNVHSSDHEGCTTSVGTESTLPPLVCSSCGSDIVSKCDAVCNTSPFPKEESTSNGVERGSSLSLDSSSSNHRDNSNDLNNSDSYCDSTCQTTSSTKHTNCDCASDN